MRHWFEHTLESVYATSKQLCGENFANGLTMAILFVKSRVCPTQGVEDDEELEGPEVLVQAVVTQVRDPPLFRQDVNEQAMNVFVEQGMMTQEEGIEFARVVASRDAGGEHNLDEVEDDDGTIVELIFENPRGVKRQDILRNDGDIAVFMDAVNEKKRN